MHIQNAWKVLRKSLRGEQASGFASHVDHILNEELPYAAAAYAAHARLSEEERGEREQIIRDMVDRIIGPVGSEHGNDSVRADILEGMIRVSFLYPTICLEMMTRVACAGAMSNLPSQENSLLIARQEMIRSRIEEAQNSGENLKLIKTYLEPAIPYMECAELEPTVEAAVETLNSQAQYADHMAALFRVFGVTFQPIFLKFRARALREVVGKSIDEFAETLEDTCAEATEAQKTYYAKQLKIVYRMMDENVPTQAAARSQRELLEMLRSTAEVEALDVINSVYSSHENETEEQSELRQAESQRIVAELLAGIDNAPKKVSKTRRTGRKKKKPRRYRSTRKTNTEPKSSIKIVKVEKKSPVNPIGDLKTYLRFVLEELKGLPARLPTNVEGAEEIASRILAMCDQITELLTSDITDVEAYQELARQADRFLTDIRAEIRRLTKRGKEITAFAKALKAAREKELVTYGRRSGGRLRRGRGTLSWTDIADHYHTRHLGNIAEIIHGDQPRLLMPDESLAYYVTTNSQSGYDFDISCHYWLRRPGSNAPPVDDDGYMNTDDWYDTYVPCFVLHVPYDD